MAMQLQWVSNDADELPFITVGPDGQCDDGTRRVVRSHVMRGKNLGRTLKRRAKKTTVERNGVVVAPRKAGTRVREGETAVAIPPKVGSEASFSEYSSELGLEMLEALHTLEHAQGPLRSSPLFEKEEPWWLHPVNDDMLALHFTIYIAKGYQHYQRGMPGLNPSLLQHNIKTLALLQQRLANGNKALCTSDSTIRVVVGFAKVAALKGDAEGATRHLKGLHKMVSMRGGLWAIDRRLLSKICYFDVGTALGTGQKTVFFSSPELWTAYLPSPRRAYYSGTGPSRKRTRSADLAIFIRSLDPHIRAIYEDLAEVTHAANLAARFHPDVNLAVYQEAMMSTLYRLVNLDVGTDNADEAMRLGLLAFASTLFAQWRGLNERYEHVARRLTSALCSLDRTCPYMPLEVKLWLHVVGCVSVFNDKERAGTMPGLARLLRELQLNAWERARRFVQAVLWVDVLHDAVAIRKFAPGLFPDDRQWK